MNFPLSLLEAIAKTCTNNWEKKKKRLGDSNLLLAISTYDKFLLPECEKVTERHADRKQKAPKFYFFLGQVGVF